MTGRRSGPKRGLQRSNTHESDIKALAGAAFQRYRSVLRGHVGTVHSCACDVDHGASQIVSCGEDGTLRLWDRATASQLRVFEGHNAPVKSCAFAVDADGEKCLVSAGKVCAV